MGNRLSDSGGGLKRQGDATLAEPARRDRAHDRSGSVGASTTSSSGSPGAATQSTRREPGPGPGSAEPTDAYVADRPAVELGAGCEPVATGLSAGEEKPADAATAELESMWLSLLTLLRGRGRDSAPNALQIEELLRDKGVSGGAVHRLVNLLRDAGLISDDADPRGPGGPAA